MGKEILDGKMKSEYFKKIKYIRWYHKLWLWLFPLKTFWDIGDKNGDKSIKIKFRIVNGKYYIDKFEEVEND